MTTAQKEMLLALNETGVSEIIVHPVSNDSTQKYELTYRIRNRRTEETQLKTIQFTHVIKEQIIMVELTYKQLELYNTGENNRDGIVPFLLGVLKKEVKAQLGGELAFSPSNTVCDYTVVYNQIPKLVEEAYKVQQVLPKHGEINIKTMSIELQYGENVYTIKPMYTAGRRYLVSIGDKLLGIDELDSRYKIGKLVESRC